MEAVGFCIGFYAFNHQYIFLCTYPPPKMKNPLQLELEKQFALDLKGSLLLRLFS